MKKTAILIVLSLLTSTIGISQVVTIDPVFATQNDSITVYFDASLGNGDLAGVSQVYAHAGLITTSSTSPTDWKYVVGNWGTADPITAMTSLGNDLHKISYKIPDFYNFPSTETVLKLAFVFRNADGSQVGRASDGSDIYVDLHQGGFGVQIISPTGNPIIGISDSVEFKIATSSAADIKLYRDNNLLVQATDDSLSFINYASTTGAGKFWLWYEVEDNGTIYTDSTYYIVRGNPAVMDPPSGILPGINYTGTNSVTLDLHAPGKSFVYVIGDFNNWEIDPQYYMNQSVDGEHFWLEINGLDPDEEYGFQYVIDEEAMRVADVYAEKLLDPWNDQYIPSDVYPNLKAYPSSKTSEIVSVLQINQPSFNWEDQSYSKPDKHNMVVYEMLIRDFVHTHSYQAVIDTLDYIQSLGINAVELMPINEFEGNDSWGYNCSFFFAPDKYYGTKNDFKALVNECHKRGIAVIMDIALNHSFGQSPMVRMYFDASAGQWGQPTPDNPWFHESARHPFNVGYDFDHEAQPTKDFVKRVLRHWINEYHVDGYRLDLSKGFTSVNSGSDVGLWGQYDQSRIDILTEYGNDVWNLDSETFMILEHFADNSEETVLSNTGFMLWGNGGHDYQEISMGYPGSINYMSYQNRGWSDPNLVSYHTSHDEERLQYKNQEFGASSGTYDITDFTTGLERLELVNVFHLPIPGPKMIWQFDELGYQFSINTCADGTINTDCRTGAKPIRWNYASIEPRRKLYHVIRSLIELKKEYPVFQTTDYLVNGNDRTKKIHLNDSQMNVAILGNFNIIDQAMNPAFQHTGIWYEYFSGDSIDVVNVTDGITLTPGEYRFYTDVKLPTPDLAQTIPFDYVLSNNLTEIDSDERFVIYPNPVSDELNIEWLAFKSDVLQVELFDLQGRKIESFQTVNQIKGVNQFSIDFAGSSIEKGMYILQLSGQSSKYTKTLLKH